MKRFGILEKICFLISDVYMCDALRDLVPYVQFQKSKKHPRRGATFGKLEAQPATLLKVTLFDGYFSRFLNCTNGPKSRKTSHIYNIYS